MADKTPGSKKPRPFPAVRKGGKPPIDWQAVERDFRAGQLSQSEIAKRHGCTVGGVNAHAKRCHWERDLSEQVRRATRAKLARDNLADETPSEVIVETAATIGAAVIKSHRRDITALRDIAAKLSADLAEALKTAEAKGEAATVRAVVSAADGVEILTRTIARLIPLERQAYNLGDSGDAGEVDQDAASFTRALARMDDASREALAKALEAEQTS